MPDHDPLDQFLRYAADKLEQNLAQVTRAVGLLTVDEFWHRPNPHTNSVANLLLHLNGNVRQWIVAGIGDEPFERNRPAEFAERGPLPVSALLSPLQHTVARAVAVLKTLNPGNLATPRRIQDYEISTLTAVFHVVEHFSFHTGQIVHATKWLRDVDLSLYDAQGHKLAGQTGGP